MGHWASLPHTYIQTSYTVNWRWWLKYGIWWWCETDSQRLKWKGARWELCENTKRKRETKMWNVNRTQWSLISSFLESAVTWNIHYGTEKFLKLPRESESEGLFGVFYFHVISRCLWGRKIRRFSMALNHAQQVVTRAEYISEKRRVMDWKLGLSCEKFIIIFKAARTIKRQSNWMWNVLKAHRHRRLQLSFINCKINQIIFRALKNSVIIILRIECCFN